MALSVPFAAWFWLIFIDIGQIPFKADYWEVESAFETTRANSAEIQGVTLVSKLVYASSIQCRITVQQNSPSDEIIATYSYAIHTPTWWPRYFVGKALEGCVHFGTDELDRMADEHEKTLKEEDGKV